MAKEKVPSVKSQVVSGISRVGRIDLRLESSSFSSSSSSSKRAQWNGGLQECWPMDTVLGEFQYPSTPTLRIEDEDEDDNENEDRMNSGIHKLRRAA